MQPHLLLTVSMLAAITAPSQNAPPREAAELRAFWNAAARGEVQRLRAVLDEHPDWISRADGDDRTALHRAAGHGKAAAVEFLLERGAPIDALAYNRFTPLHLAAMHGSIETVRRLLAKNPDVEARTSFDRTALQIAAEADLHALVKVLLDHGAAHDLHTAACRGDRMRTQQLAAIAETRVKFATLRIAVERGHAELLATLLTIPRANELPPMMAGTRLPLAFYGTAHADVIEALVTGGVDPLARGPKALSRLAPQYSTVLHHAAGLGHTATLHYLLGGPLATHPGAVDLRDRQGHSPFHRAVAAGHLAAMVELSDHGADLKAVDNTGRSAVHLAALAGHMRAIEWLVRKGAKLDAVDQNGSTAVALTASRLPWDAAQAAEQMRVLELLQRLGSPIDLHAAAVLGDAARVRALLARPEHEPTAAMAARAVLFDRPAALAAFVAAGLAPNARHWHERTLLHIAVIRNAPDCARWLLEHGADPTLEDAHGKLARQWLSPRSSPELRAIFE